MTLSRCLQCGSTNLVERTVEKVLCVRGGQHVVAVPATVCLGCGERYFALDVIELFEAKASNRQ